ncbi:basic phospholipase A2 Ts-G6D49-like [Rhinatrema bivittatum]|uniref:basic phospholipase A2 Ts-G6D49-like n=1 Tax=Rhinatrema bivittatum TaxID=194408 RepID=UPI001127907D|nr:basic phospholipase A2 Ts-G6D49-like [Rhinatrema bivittatum]
MNHLFPLALVIAVCIARVAHASLLEFGIMIYQMTKRNPLIYYIAYGCHCGHSGKGAPKDEIDWCCHAHDCCFDRISKLGCHPKTQSYKYAYLEGNVTCIDPENETLASTCARQICECDKEAALCFKRNNDNYKGKYTMYSNLFCTGLQPQC